MKQLIYAAAVAAFGLSSPATAADVIVTANPYGAGGLSGGIRVASLNFANSGPTGRFNVTGAYLTSTLPFLAYTFCIDVTKPFFANLPDGQFTIGTLTAFSSDTTKQAQVAALLLNTQKLIDGVSSKTDRQFAAVATGLAIWEILYEPGISGYSVNGPTGAAGDGNFSVYGGFDAYKERTNEYLANVESGKWTGSTSRIRTLISVTGNSQNQIFVTGVPEPTIWAMMFVGFGAIGAKLRRRTATGPFEASRA